MSSNFIQRMTSNSITYQLLYLTTQLDAEGIIFLPVRQCSHSDDNSQTFSVYQWQTSSASTMSAIDRLSKFSAWFYRIVFMVKFPRVFMNDGFEKICVKGTSSDIWPWQMDLSWFGFRHSLPSPEWQTEQLNWPQVGWYSSSPQSWQPLPLKYLPTGQPINKAKIRL